MFLVVLCCFSSYSNAQTIIDGDPTALNLADDSWSNIDLGFDVTYFGETFDSITVYTNGMTLFGDNRGYANNCCNGYKPTQDQHDYGIFPFWTDLITINNNDEYNGVYYLSDSIDTLQIGWINMQEYYNNQTNNTFGLEIKSTSTGVSIDFLYDELEINNHSIWSGLTGDVSEGEVIENFFHNRQSGLFSGDSNLDWSYTYIDCSNPLNDPSCEGYEQAYTEQQCQQDPLYDQSCSGYDAAYLNQQCQQDALYNSSCPGYDEAYENQQCSIDSLYSPRCDGYYQAYEEQQCELDSQYSFSCPNYIFEAPEEYGIDSFYFEDFSGSDSGSDYDAFGNVQEEFTFEEEFVYEDPVPFNEPFEEELIFQEEFVIEEEEQEILEEMFEEFTEELDEDDIDEESEENITPLSEINAGEISAEREISATPRRSGSRVGLSVGLNTVDSLVGGLISRSIESGLSDAAQGVGSGSFYSSDTQNMANLAATGGNFADFTDNITSDQQNDTNIAVGIGAGPIILPQTSSNQDNMTEKIVREPSLAEKMAEKVRKKNLDNQKGIFNKQITMLEGIANGNNLNKYYEERLSDASDWYGSGQVYAGNRLSDSDRSYYRLNSENYGIMQQLIRSQY